MNSTNPTVNLREGIFRDASDGPVLVGHRCTACGQIHFPGGELCLSCLNETLEPVDLSQEGELFCETTVHMKTAHFDPPYSVGYIALPEGIKIFAPIRKIDGLPLKVGMRMRVELASMWEEDGKNVLAYRFHPV